LKAQAISMASPADYSSIPVQEEFSENAESGSTSALLDEKHIKLPASTSFRTMKRKELLVAMTLVGLLAAGILAYAIPLSLQIAERKNEFGDCGSTIDEARAKGCMFDNLSFAWQQPACFHGELLECFRARSNITYYTSPNMSPETRIPDEEVYNGDWADVFATKEQHQVHCAFMLTKLHEATLNHLPLDSEVMGFEHTIHCGQVLMQDWLHELKDCNEGKCELVLATQKFTRCGFY
jgi:hypothetical protein